MKRLILAAIVVLILAACQQAAPKIALADLPVGDVERGQNIFQQGSGGSVACATCHRTDELSLVGPGLAGLSQRAVERVSGESAKEYLYNSILRPAKYLVTGFSNLMPQDFETQFSAQDVADLIAYLMTL